MESSRFERLAPWAGIAFGVLIIVAAGLILARMPDPEDPDAKIVEFYKDTTAHVLMIIGVYVWVIASMSFLWFLTQLRARLAAAEGGAAGVSSVAYLAGVLFIVFMVFSALAIVTPAGTIELGGSDETLDPDYMRIMPQLGFGAMRIAAAMSSIVMIYCTSFLAMRTGVFTRRVAWTGFILAPFSLLLLTPVPMIAIPVWVIVVSVAMMGRAPQSATA